MYPRGRNTPDSGPGFDRHEMAAAAPRPAAGCHGRFLAAPDLLPDQGVRRRRRWPASCSEAGQVSVTSITARLPRVEDRLLLHKQMIETLPLALLVLDAATQIVVEHNAAASVFFERVLAAP